MKRTVNKTPVTHVKRTLMALILVMMASLAVIGCKKDKKPEGSLNDRTDKAVTDAENETDRDRTAENTKKPRAGALIDITSKEDIDKFLTGKWRLVDTVGGGEFATLVIYDDGKCEYDRDTDNFLVEGDFSVKKHQTFDEKTDELIDDEQYTGFDLSFYDVPEDFNPPGQDYYKVDDESVDGNFHIARGDGYDYLYLEWVGNGDSYIFGFMFQNAERIQKEYDEAEAYTPQGEMVFRRANEGLADTEPVADDKFFGLIWENEENSLWIQAMDVHTSESEDEYTGRRYKKAYFTEQEDMGLREYSLAKDADTSLVLDTAQLKKEHPVMMCGFETDEKGQISRISEIDKAIYGTYDLGSTRQEYSYDGLKFTVNGYDYDLKEQDSEASGIADMKLVGDWIVVKANVPPHYSEYYLVNIYSGNLEKTINGENLTWVDDDITTAVYSSGGSIYNFKDHVIGTTDGAEVRDIKLRSGGKEVVARDDNDETYFFELEDDDEAMYRYADFAVEHTAQSWKEFMNCAPEDAIAYVMVSPPDVVKNRLSWLQKVDEGSRDCVYVVALKDETVIHADSGRYDVDKNRFDIKKTFDQTELLKGYSRGYEIFVTEGVPYYCIYISADDEGGIFPIAMISGKSDQCGMFITPSMTGEEALKASTADAAKNFDLIDSYMDVLFRYKEAQDNKYSQEEIDKMGLTTQLTQQAWPSANSDDAVKYVLYDIDGNGINELIITYYDSITDIWASDGSSVRYAYGCPYRGQAILHEDGMLEQLYAPSMSSASTTWYAFNASVGDFFADFQMLYDPSEKASKAEYYRFSYHSGREEMELRYRISGDYPVWVSEWEDQISEKEYNELCSKAPAVKLPEGERIADFRGL